MSEDVPKPYEIIVQFPGVVHRRKEPSDTTFISPKLLNTFGEYLEGHPNAAAWLEHFGVELDEQQRQVEIRAEAIMTAAGALAIVVAVGAETTRRGKDIRTIINWWNNRKANKKLP